MNTNIPITASARKHGVSDDDIRHAHRNAIRTEQLDERAVMLIGPGRSAQLLEIGLVLTATGPMIVHAMTARRKYLPRFTYPR
jgi:hypothetical protein